MAWPATCLLGSLQLAETPRVGPGELENKPGGPAGPPPQQGGRGVQVTGAAQLSAAPDRARVRVQVTSNKGTAAEAKDSVQRRLEYIAQSLRQSGVRDENRTITKELQRTSNVYHMEAEVCVIFNDFEKMQSVSNTLVEKLNSSISICSPQFYHTPECVEKLRREVCLSAVSNARQKAQDVCLLVGQSLGRPLMIKEEEMREWEDQGENNSGSPTIQQKIKSCTLHAASKVFATFEIKGKVRPKNN
ncbi:interleukin-1 receptor-associated kinase 1-binding protein 1 [Ascaphus truei]|uniref:interleukin-1 receptor-associated kinase 1-binding protein 1 n=1 Tax=Ascaphus truei TaxID=8439 RepID=UPI003F5AA9B9